ncbi:LysM peptidoglycan-binding domain-containing protein [Priestia filamentosa]
MSQNHSLREIAAENGISVRDLVRANKTSPPYRADTGDQVEVPFSMVRRNTN